MSNIENDEDNGSDIDIKDNEDINSSSKEKNLEVPMEKGKYNVHILVEEVKNFIRNKRKYPT